jgi:hypothetical protein
MSLLAFASVKGSPGVTTTVLALASVWPTSQHVIVAEVDPAGGDLATRFGRSFEPGVISLAAAARRASGSSSVVEHCQQLLGGVDVLVSPASADQANAAIRLLDDRGIWAELRGGEQHILADCGRLGAGSTVAPVVQASTLLVLLTRPLLSELHHLHSRLPALQSCARRVALVLVGNGPYSASEVADTLSIEVLGSLPSDADSAGMLAGAPGSRRALARLPLLRSASALVDQLQTATVTSDDKPRPTGDVDGAQRDQVVLAGHAT